VYWTKGNGTGEYGPVRVAWTEGGTTVIASGLKNDEQVVTDGQLRLTPGARVTVKPAVGKTDPTPAK